MAAAKPRQRKSKAAGVRTSTESYRVA